MVSGELVDLSVVERGDLPLGYVREWARIERPK